MFKKKRIIAEQTKTIADLTAKNADLLQETETLKDKIAEYQRMETAISKAITDAALTADRIIEDAHRESDEIHDAAQKDFMDSQKQGSALMDTAYEKARDIVKDAEGQSKKKLLDTDAAVAAYVELLNQFNENMKEQAKQAEENAKKYAEYYSKLSSTLPELFSEVPTLSEKAAAVKEEPLPDPEGDPGQLMKNIYVIEKRQVPDSPVPDRTSEAEEADNPEPEAQSGGDEAEKPFNPQEQLSEEDGWKVVKVSDLVDNETEETDTEKLIEQAQSKEEA